MKKALFAAVLLAFWGCDSSSDQPATIPVETVQPELPQLKHEVLQEGTGRMPVDGDLVRVHYTGLLKDGKQFDSSYDRGAPLWVVVGGGMVVQGWEEGLKLMKEGELCRLTIPSHMAYGAKGFLNLVPPNADLIFQMELVEVIDYPFKTKDEGTTTESGLTYHIVKESDGDFPQPGQKVAVHYTGYFQNGQIFDSSILKGGETYSFTLGAKEVITAWDEGVALMKVGERIKLIVPPHLAYGEAGYPPVIPPNSTLTFDIELMAITE